MTIFFFINNPVFWIFYKGKTLAHGTKWLHPENDAVFYKFKLFLPNGCLLIFFPLLHYKQKYPLHPMIDPKSDNPMKPKRK